MTQFPLLSAGHCGSIVLEMVVGRDLWDPLSPAFHLKQDCDLWYCRSVMALFKLPLKASKNRGWPAFLGVCSCVAPAMHKHMHPVTTPRTRLVTFPSGFAICC